MENNSSSCYVVGLMSGTSLDGIDAALVKISDSNGKIGLRPVQFSSLSFINDIKNKILDLCVPETARIENISVMNMLLGELFAEAAEKVIKEAGLSPKDILLISSHGQTIYHQPDSVILDGKEITSTLQIGDIGVVAERTGITTVGDFRTRDMAAGGQGAPLVPYADYMLFKEKEFGRVLVNIGGISNVTILPKDSSESNVIAYDTGPGNMIIDAFTNWATNGEHSYDKDGSLAANGNVCEKWLEVLLKHDYFELPAPKSTGREMFGLHFAKDLWNEAENYQIKDVDKIATVTDLTAKTIAMEINQYVDSNNLEEVLISGGGWYNKTLIERLTFFLAKAVQVKTTDEYDMPADAKEAITFALLGYQCYRKKTNNLPSATGAKNEVVMGKIAW